MGHHHARDGYETVKIPEKYRALLRRLQRGTWSYSELAWILRPASRPAADHRGTGTGEIGGTAARVVTIPLGTRGTCRSITTRE
jgi:hypothetical protein